MVKFATRIEAFGDTPALINADQSIVTYAQLVDIADAVVRDWGQRRRLVLIECANDVMSIAAYVGALRKGHVVILASEDSLDADSRILRTYQPEILFRRNADTWGSVASSAQPPTLHEQLSVLLSTSGSTGNPKLVRLSHNNIQSNAEAICQYLQIRKTDRAITTLPWHYSYGLSIINSYLLSGASIILSNRSVIDDQFWSLFNESAGTSIAGVPHTFELLDRLHFRDRAPPVNLRYMTLAGGRLDTHSISGFADWAAKHNIEFFVMYGQTEAAPRMAYLPPHLAQHHPDKIGIPIPGGEFRIVDSQGNDIHTPEAVGDLVYRGPNVMMGYATCRDDLGKASEVSELVTGDLACRTSEGLYRIIGRRSRFSKMFGLRISLDDIEQFLEQEGIRSKVSGNDDFIAVGVLERDFIGQDLSIKLSEKYKIPRNLFVVFPVESFPSLSSGKTDYRSIESLARSIFTAQKNNFGVASPSDHQESSSSLGEEIASLMGHNKYMPTDTFISLGGDSLSFVQASILLEERLGYLPEGWESMQIAELERQERRPVQSAALVAPAGMPTELLLRAIAILGVVLTHSQLVSVGGGAFLLLTLAGFAFARFQRERLWSGDILQACGPLLLRILLPYFAILIAYSLARGGIDPRHWLLVANFYPSLQASSGILPYFWFIENFLQIILIFSVAFSVPSIRKWFRREPLNSALVLLLTSFSVAYVSMRVANFSADIELLREGHYFDRTPIFTFCLFCFGWCMYFADTNRDRFILTCLALIIFWSTKDQDYATWLIAGTTFAIWIPRVVVLSPARSILLPVAASTFHIFLIHMLPIHIMIHIVGASSDVWKAVSVLLAVLFGIALNRAVRWTESRVLSFSRPRQESYRSDGT